MINVIEALSFVEISNIYNCKIIEVANAIYHRPHETDNGFNRYRFWEDLILLTGEVIANEQEPGTFKEHLILSENYVTSQRASTGFV